MMGGACSASAIAGILAGCHPAKRSAYVPQTLTASQDDVVAALAELIIPTTDTPGGRAAGVNVFIDGMLTSIFTVTERTRFLAGLADLEARAAAAGASFLASSPHAQVRLLKELEAETIAAQASVTANPTFFHALKTLTLVGYYNSEIGATQELKYVAVPGSYNGDVLFKEIGRAWCRPGILEL